MPYDEKLCDERHDKIEESIRTINKTLADGLKAIIGVLASAFIILAGTVITLIIVIWSMYHPAIQAVVQRVTTP
jgi:type IV secretory pathway TrbL component